MTMCLHNLVRFAAVLCAVLTGTQSLASPLHGGISRWQGTGAGGTPMIPSLLNEGSGNLRLRGGAYTLGLRDSIMIAHSFKGEEFGPAQNMHGATYTVDVEFHVKELAPRLNWVMDIGEGMTVLKAVLAEYNFKNLNDLFPSENTTTEFMCKKIFDGLKARLTDKLTGEVTVKLWESHNAWASYSALL